MWRTEINNGVAISLYKHAGRRVHRPCAARCELTTQRIAAHAYLCVHSFSTLDAKVRLISLSDCVEHYRVSDAFGGLLPILYLEQRCSRSAAFWVRCALSILSFPDSL